MSEIKPSLQLTYDPLLKVLRAWNEYLFIEFNEMPRNFEVMTNADYGGGFQELGDADAKENKFRRHRSAALHADFAGGVLTPPLTKGNGVPFGIPYFSFGDPAAS